MIHGSRESLAIKNVEFFTNGHFLSVSIFLTQSLQLILTLTRVFSTFRESPTDVHGCVGKFLCAICNNWNFYFLQSICHNRLIRLENSPTNCYTFVSRLWQIFCNKILRFIKYGITVYRDDFK